jgi:hypothetical protein
LLLQYHKDERLTSLDGGRGQQELEKMPQFLVAIQRRHDTGEAG